MRLLLCLLPIALLASPALSSSASPAVWTVEDDGKGQVRSATFEVADAQCAYSLIGEPEMMQKHIEFVEKAEVHMRRGSFQHVTLTERFFPVGLVESRYHRNADGKAHVTWVLQEGRQERHDGEWTVVATDRGARVTFDNVIEAKSFLHQPILESIQKRAMAHIVEAAWTACGGL